MNRITKNLKWRGLTGNQILDAESPLEDVNFYSVGPNLSDGWYAKADHGKRDSGPEETWFGTRFNSKAEAKAACEQHYDNAVRNLLTPEAMEALAFASENIP